MALAIALLLFVVLLVAITWVGYRRYARPGRVYERLGGLVSVEMPGMDPAGAPEGIGLPVHVLQMVGEKVPVSPADVMAVRKELISAGYRSASSVAVLFGIRVIVTVLLFLLALSTRDYVTNITVLRIVFVIAFTGAGWMLPMFVLERMVDARRERIRFGLPDALDLMVIAVEAGLALDQAIQYVSREIGVTHTDVAEEFGLVNLEMRAGKGRSEALRNLVERTGEKETRKLVAILIQTDRFGTSIAESLRTHSDFMRVRRRQEAEERAGKVGVKLVFPIFFFILPSMLVVAAGPGLLQIFKQLFPMMRHFSG
jgi:tight adherence protein C